jgi:hypothetical protein
MLGAKDTDYWKGFVGGFGKLCGGLESNTSGAKALIIGLFTARLKPCPDTKHESGGSSGCG